MYPSDPCAGKELLGSRDPANSPSVFKQERPKSPTFSEEEYYLFDIHKEHSKMESDLLIPSQRSYYSKRKGMPNHTYTFVFTSIFSVDIYLQGKRNAEITIPRSSVTKGLTSDSEIEELDSVQGGAPCGKMQHQDPKVYPTASLVNTKCLRVECNTNIAFLVEKIPDVATTATLENVTISLDMSTGSPKGTATYHFDDTSCVQKIPCYYLHGNTSSNYTVNGEAAASTPQHALEEI
ncbi:hypothetical protein BOTCAL_0314g00030 [Botryotinia calthae]|uniref:Uncharacterized protein n=1 Tax=Botryotinia calthae TaxID=38488 RepID=A0A4Y8CTV4_9HELO|nr:hypothetical protein BOTCAL_0314g00030 [Botryotinia calthae]